jgi:hypothetical protein
MRQYSLLVAPTTTRRDGLTAKIPNDDDEEEANQAGMASAFRELEALDSLDDDDKSVPKKGASSIKGIDDLEDVKQLKNMKATPEAEVKLYKDMMNESEKEDVELYVDIMTDMGGTTPKPKKKQTLKIQDEQVELLDSLERSPEDLNVFMNQALQEALKEAKSKTPEELASIDPLDDEDMMDEIRNVFDRANDELLASLEDIRKEQAELAKMSAQQNAASRMELEAENEKRMQVAQESMENMLKKVNEETLEVEKAVRDLKAAHEELGQDPLYKLKSGGIVKQASLVGTALFSVRAVTELAAMAGPNGEAHTLPALIQGVIAFVCAAYFFLF